MPITKGIENGATKGTKHVMLQYDTAFFDSIMASPASHPPVPNCIISFPTQQILLVTLNRPKQLNCIDVDTSRQMQRLWEWFDQNTSLVVGVITGSGRAFCTGADLNGIPGPTMCKASCGTDTDQNGTGSMRLVRCPRWMRPGSLGCHEGGVESQSSRPSTGSAWGAVSR